MRASVSERLPTLHDFFHAYKPDRILWALGTAPDSKVYDPPGSCIYCGATRTTTGSRLQREHIIPFGLSGRLVYYVGSPWCSRTRKSESLHQVRLEIRNGRLVSFVQLFARYHAPRYYVVVGKPKEPLARWSRGKVFSPKLVDDVFNGREKIL